jgi:hypothetical protein
VARERLEDFNHGPWGQKYPAIAQSWRRNWEQVIPFFAFAPELRKILYTTNAIESLNAQVRKALVCNALKLSHFTGVKLSHWRLVVSSLFSEILIVWSSPR